MSLLSFEPLSTKQLQWILWCLKYGRSRRTCSGKASLSSSFSFRQSLYSVKASIRHLRCLNYEVIANILFCGRLLPINTHMFDNLSRIKHSVLTGTGRGRCHSCLKHRQSKAYHKAHSSQVRKKLLLGTREWKDFCWLDTKQRINITAAV